MFQVICMALSYWHAGTGLAVAKTGFGTGQNLLGITQSSWASCASAYTCSTAPGTCTAIQAWCPHPCAIAADGTS